MRLAIVATHPIQYNAPLFRELARRPELTLKVFYGWEGTAHQADPEFGHEVSWDVPLLDGYDWELTPNRSRDPGTHHFGGLDNPTMIPATQAWGPNAVLVYGWSNRTHLRVLRAFKGRVPVLLRGDSTLLSGAKGLRRLVRRPLLRWVYSHVDLALYPGRRNREYLEACGVAGPRLAWMPHCVENGRFSDGESLEQQAAAARAALGIRPDQAAFLFAGKLIGHKQVGLLIHAFETSQRDNDSHLIIVGSGPLERELQERARGAAHVHFLGFRNQSEMPLIYRLGDLFVLPSSSETWGLAVNEAMASGLPVVLSDRVGSAPDLAADPGFARTFPSGDVGALGRILSDLGADRARLRQMGEKARGFIQDWSVEHAADRLCRSLATFCSAVGPDTTAERSVHA